MDHLVYTPHISTGELINVKYQLRLFMLYCFIINRLKYKYMYGKHFVLFIISRLKDISHSFKKKHDIILIVLIVAV